MFDDSLKNCKWYIYKLKSKHRPIERLFPTFFIKKYQGLFLYAIFLGKQENNIMVDKFLLRPYLFNFCYVMKKVATSLLSTHFYHIKYLFKTILNPGKHPRSQKLCFLLSNY